MEGPLPRYGASYEPIGKDWLLDCFQSVILEAEAVEEAEEEAALGQPSYMHYSD